MWHHPKVQYLFLTRTRDLVYILHIPSIKDSQDIFFFDGDILMRKKNVTLNSILAQTVREPCMKYPRA